MTELQKASLSKRIAAGMLDAMLLCVLVTGIAVLLMAVFDYDGKTAELTASYTHYEALYETDFAGDYSALEGADKEKYEEGLAAFYADKEVQKQISAVMSVSVLIATFSILLGMAVTEFAVPLVLKNGQTLGKKVFALGVMRVDSVRISPVQLFVRTVLGKFAIETMVCVYLVIMILFNAIGIVGPLVIAGILLLQGGCMLFTKTNSMVHDLMAATVVVDFASQRIFRSSEELMEYQKEIAAEQAARQNY